MGPEGLSCRVRFSTKLATHTHEMCHEAAVLVIVGGDMRPSKDGDITDWGPSALERTVLMWLSTEEGDLSMAAHWLFAGLDTGCC